MRKLKGFTLIEVLTVLIIVSILAAVALVTYGKQIEKSRASEAYTNLQQLRKIVLLYRQRYGGNPATGTSPAICDTSNAALADVPLAPCASGSPFYDCSNNAYYFQYMCGTYGNCRAYRCISGGKVPNSTVAYQLVMNVDTGKVTCADPVGAPCP